MKKILRWWALYAPAWFVTLVTFSLIIAIVDIITWVPLWIK